VVGRGLALCCRRPAACAVDNRRAGVIHVCGARVAQRGGVRSGGWYSPPQQGCAPTG